jgi:hypothetical protein
MHWPEPDLTLVGTPTGATTRAGARSRPALVRTSAAARTEAAARPRSCRGNTDLHLEQLVRKGPRGNLGSPGRERRVP